MNAKEAFEKSKAAKARIEAASRRQQTLDQEKREKASHKFMLFCKTKIPIWFEEDFGKQIETAVEKGELSTTLFLSEWRINGNTYQNLREIIPYLYQFLTQKGYIILTDEWAAVTHVPYDPEGPSDYDHAHIVISWKEK